MPVNSWCDTDRWNWRQYARAGCDDGTCEDDRTNRKRIAAICPLVSLSADVSRLGAEVSGAYTATLRSLLDDVARRIPSAGDARARALAAVALCVGGVVLAHAVDDEQLAEDLLDACRARATAEVEGR